MLIGAEFLGRAINMIVSILMRRWLLPERMGVVGTISSYGVLPSIIGEAGLTRGGIQQIARSDPDGIPRLIGHMAATRFATNFLYLVIVWLSLLLPFNDKLAIQEKWFIVIWSLSMVLQSWRRNAEAAFIAAENIKYHSLLMVVNRLLSGALVLGIIQWNRDTLDVPHGTAGWYNVIGMVFGAYLLTDFLDATASWILLKKKVGRPVFNLDWKPKLQLLKYGWPFALQMLAGQIYFFVNVPLIRYLYDKPDQVLREVGDYTTAYNMILVLISLPINLTYTLFPQMSRAFHVGDRDRLYSLFGHSLHLMLLCGAPIAIAFYLFRSEFITLVYGSVYKHAIPMLGLLAWTLPFAFVNAPLSNLLAASDRQTFVNLSMGCAALFNVVMNVLLIPTHGAIGSSLVTLQTECVMLAIQLILVIVFHRNSFNISLIAPLVFFQVAAAGAFIAVQQQHVLLRIVAYLVYGLVCLLWTRHIVRRRRLEGT